MIQPNDILNAIYLVLIAGFFLEITLVYLNLSRLGQGLPAPLMSVYTEETYLKSIRYERENQRFGVLTSSLGMVVLLALLFTGGFGWLHYAIVSIIDSPLVVSLVYIGVLYFASDLASIPFQVYDTFVIEQKFGFNKTTPRLFIIDKIKSWGLGILLGGGVLAIVIGLYNYWGTSFWWMAWIVSSVFVLLLSLTYSTLIVPLFNKQTTLGEGELREAIEQYCQSVDFKLSNVFVIDGSKRSGKANAYFSGFGPRKRIVLYDTLVDQLTTREIVAVLAHEVGHYKKKHTLKGIVLSIVQTGITFFLFSLLVGNPVVSLALGVNEPVFHIGMMVFGILYSPVSTIIGIAFNGYTRAMEYEADAFARDTYNGEDLVSALSGLSRNNLSNLNPHPAVVFVNYSHPPLLQRINAIRADGDKNTELGK